MGTTVLNVTLLMAGGFIAILVNIWYGDFRDRPEFYLGWVVKLAVKLLPPELRERYGEEWASDLRQGTMAQRLCWSFGFLWSGAKLGASLGFAKLHIKKDKLKQKDAPYDDEKYTIDSTYYVVKKYRSINQSAIDINRSLEILSNSLDIYISISSRLCDSHREERKDGK